MGFGRRILFGLAFALGAAALQACAPGPQGGPAGGGAPLGYAPGEEARLYERLNRQWQRPLACQYLRRFPTGPHYAEVRDRVFLFYGRNACNLPFEREFRPV